MTQTDFQQTTLPCGLRVVHDRTSSGVIYCGYIVLAGTRHEAPADSGMAHFIEHLSFKGTERRRAFHISNGLERVGGDLNAFTNKQETVYYATVLRPDFARAVDLLTDLVFHSVYPQHEIDREVEVICDEIDSYKDTPSELIFDEFESMLFSGNPLGRDILGDTDRLRSYTTADARRFTDCYYRPDNAVFYVRGDLDFNRVVRTLERFLPATPSDLPLPSKPLSPTLRREAEERVVEKHTHQAHVLIGTQTYGGSDERRFGLMLLNNMLGGPGMNSRLNMSLREHSGLVYSVDASLTTYPDAGTWGVYFGCDAHDVARCRRLVNKELRRFIDDLLSPAQLAAAKKQLCGQIGIACDNAENYALAMGKTFAHYNARYDVPALCQRLHEVTADELQTIAAEVYDPARLTTLIYR
ncbi:MAG: pitrilysin family protein [Bacteroidales bacterium]|nr:pitrilysin family protein [Bacteroidales bacterium]